MRKLSTWMNNERVGELTKQSKGTCGEITWAG